MRQLIAITLIFIIISLPEPVLPSDRPFAEKSLPIELTGEEKLRLHEIGINHRETSPPPGQIRNPGEWEPSEGVIIRYPLGIPIELIVELSEDLIVYTIVSGYLHSNAVSYYISSGVNMDNTEFIIAETNSIWTRDYGPWFIFDGTGEMGIVDHIYNRPRPLDDVIPAIIGAEWSMNVYGMDVVHTGGNHMSDGTGMSMSTRLVYAENTDKTETEVDALMYDYLGNDYTVLDYIETGGIHHIDCWAKFLDPATILIKDVPPEDAGYSLLNERADFLSQQMSSWNRPYEIIRVFCPGGTAYTNSIILNNKVFVPIFGGSNTDADSDAMTVYEQAMPGYEILGFYGSWYSNDAIHCRAMGVPDRDMLHIHHIPVYYTDDTENDYLISVNIIDHSETGLDQNSLKIFYKIDGDYLSTPLSSTANPDSYAGYIPAQPFGTYISYYVQAADNSDRTETHPYIGAPGPHIFKINMTPEFISTDSFACKSPGEFKYCPAINDIDDESHDITYLDYPGWMTIHNDTLTGYPPEENGEANFAVEASDGYAAAYQDVKVMFYLCGDIDSDNIINILDVVYLINNIYKGGPDPRFAASADVDNSGELNILDVVHLINFLYKTGPSPDCP